MIRVPPWVSFLIFVVAGTNLGIIRITEGEDGAAELNVGEIKALILELPTWPFVPVLEDRKKEAAAWRAAEKIEGIVGDVSKQCVERIRAAIHEIETSSNDSQDLERLFIVNQYLFAIPDKVAKDSPHLPYLFSGYSGMPESVMETNGWPWEQDKAGAMRFSTKAHGIQRMGPPYPATKLFDYFSKQFGLRTARAKP